MGGYCFVSGLVVYLLSITMLVVENGRCKCVVVIVSVEVLRGIS